MRDREFEGLQVKVQRLEKLSRALQIERNELSKKVQSLSGKDDRSPGAPTTDPGAESPSLPPTDSPQEPSPDPDSSPSPDPTPCSHSCHCGPELDTESPVGEACAQPLTAQDWGFSLRQRCSVSPPPPANWPACKPLLLRWMKLILSADPVSDSSREWVNVWSIVSGRVNLCLFWFLCGVHDNDGKIVPSRGFLSGIFLFFCFAPRSFWHLDNNEDLSKSIDAAWDCES